MLWVIPNRLYGQLPFAARPVSHPDDDSIIGECQNWAELNFSVANPVNAMIGLSSLASTKFARRFKRATGERPIDYIHMLMLEKAKSLLEENRIKVDEIGRLVGYEDPASFRRVFKR